MKPRLWVTIGNLVLIAAALAVPQVAAAETGPAIASLEAETPISAGAGWLVWSTPVKDGWGLDAYHAGKVAALPVSPRPEPFDASVGTNARGAAVVTFSRCTETPRLEGAGEVGGGSLMYASTGRGCRIMVLKLAGGRERRLPVPSAPRDSDTSPSMWHGELAFARKTPTHGDVWQIMSWSARDPSRLTTLRHGAIPLVCEGGCSAAPAHGEVGALDRDGSIVTFMWRVEGPGVIGEGAWEIRVDQLANGRSSRADGGFGHEACTGPTAENEIEYLLPTSAPVASGQEVLFSQLETFGCFERFASRLDAYAAGATLARYARIPTALALAKDGSTFYAELPQEPLVDAEDSPRCTPAAPCTLQRIAPPPLTKREKPFRPFR
jgi:hypothetical protein